jgi:segregation and condensation protein A
MTREVTETAPRANTMAPMSYEVSTQAFDGPLDLLLQLVTARRVDIAELSLGELVAEYLAYLELARELDLEITSEFLLIAATLIQLKARRLLPGEPDLDLDEELALAQERDRLLSRLLACLTYRDVAAVIAHRMEGAARFAARDGGLDPGIRPLPPELRLTITGVGFAELATRVLARRRDPDLDHLDLDLPSVADAIADVRRRLHSHIEFDFDALVAHLARPVEVVAYFLAVLELARWGLVKARQVDHGAPIVLEGVAARHEAPFMSEWDR